MVARILIVAAVLAHAGCTTDHDAARLEWAEHPELGTILTDGEGRTLYVFANDEEGQSNCHGQCAVNWPPLLTEGEPTAADGVEGSVGTTERDGGTQVTYDGAPLYHYANDETAGDANGHDVGGVWFVVTK